MRHFLTTLALAASVASFVFPAVAFADSAEEIRLFSVDLQVLPDSMLHVRESIEYDFGENMKHGIFRKIPLADGEHRLRVRNVSVTDEDGTLYPFTDEGTRKEAYLRIGDPDVYVDGVHTYVIAYDIEGALGYFDDFDEIYWNATGNEWEVPLNEARVTVRLPQSVEQASLAAACYRGLSGSEDVCEKSEITQTGEVVFSESLLEPGEGLTVAVGFPKGIVVEPPPPTLLERVLAVLGSVWFIPLPFLVVAFWFRKSISYWKRRRAFYRNNTIIPEYDAGEVDPLEAAGLLEGRVDGKALSAEIISLAERGYLRIKSIDDEYFFESTEKDESGLPAYDKSLLSGIKGQRESDLVLAFSATATAAGTAALQSLSVRDYFEPGKVSASENVRSTALFLSFFFAINPGIFIWIFSISLGFVFSTSCVLIGLVYLLVRPRKHRLTDKGLAAERQLLGLKQYVDVAEDDRIAFHNAPEKSPTLFEKLLPYAMVFGLEKQWAKQFASIVLPAPAWYSSQSGTAFSPVAFGNELSHFASSMKSAATPPSSSGSSGGSGSGGGGSSGGGGGGGGGGSW